MRYHRAIEYLFGLQHFGIKLGLDNITRVLAALGNPHRRLNCIHIAGTNGKGSTSAFLHAILVQAGCRAGLYTSPHLNDFTERIRIQDKNISKAAAAELIGDLRSVCRKKSIGHITFFEFTTALAFLYFNTSGADPVLVETGLGGTYDATNVINPALSIITSIGLEHQKYLGKTLTAIASEKAGIIKPGKPLVCGATQQKVISVFLNTCRNKDSRIVVRGRDFSAKRSSPDTFTYASPGLVLRDVQPGLRGDHQVSNAALAIAAAEIMRLNGYAIADYDIRNGISQAFWPGRFEQLGASPVVIADGAHNPQGCRALMRTLAGIYPGKKKIFIVGLLQDKDIAGMLKILTPHAAALIVCRPQIGRAADRDILENFISFSDKKKVFWKDNSIQAYATALRIAGSSDLICITGSLFLVGELRQFVLKKRGSSSGRIAL